MVVADTRVDEREGCHLCCVEMDGGTDTWTEEQTDG